MKKILELFILDWKRILGSKMSLLIILGLMIIPSLYAWFNIMALWDPYGSTSQLPIAVVSLDDGTTLEDEKINFGDEIIDNLHENKEIGWVFCNSKKEVNDGVNAGEYFAGIIVDKDFSKDLVSFVNGDPVHPKINYLVNLKINAIAPKISDKGVDSIKAEVTSDLTSTISKTILESTNTLGTDLDKNKGTLEDYITVINDAQNNLDKDKNLVDEVHAQRMNIDEYKEKLSLLDKYPTYADKIYKITPMVKEITGELDTIDSKLKTISGLSKYETKVNTTVDKINDVHGDIITLNQKITEENIKIEKQISTIENEEKISNDKKEEAEKKLSELEADSDKDLKLNTEDKKDSELSENKQIAENDTTDTVDSDEVERAKSDANMVIDEVKDKIPELEETKTKLEKVNNNLTRVNDSLTTVNENLNVGTDAAFSDIKQINDFYNNSWPSVKAEIVNLNDFLQNDWPKLDKEIRDSIVIVNNKTDELFEDLIYVDNKLQELWPQYQSAIINLNKNIDKASDKVDIEKIIDILMYNPENQSEFFKDPVKIKEKDLYPVPNYGSQSTPFYTALCLWVGGLLLVSVLTVSYHVPKKGKYTKRQQYMARQLTFITIAIFQGLIVEIGNIYLLDVYMKNPLINFLSVILVAIVFNIIIFTFTALFDNFGKVIGIVLLVLSVSAGGGNFPIQLSSEFFQIINPFLPFTYAVDLLRESVGGVYMPRVWETSTILIIMGGLMLSIGVVLYPLISEKIIKAMDKAKSSHIIH